MTSHFSNRVIYNDQLFRDVGDVRETIITFNAQPDLAKVLPYDDIHKTHAEYAANATPFYAPLSVQFSQSSTKKSYTATRLCMYAVLQ